MRVLVLLLIWAVFLSMIETDIARDRAARKRAHIKLRASARQVGTPVGAAQQHQS